MICPQCKGQKQIEVLAHLASGGCKMMMINCTLCEGAGEITEEHQQRIIIGQQKREDRLKRGLSQSEEAYRLGMTRYEYSCVEHPRPLKVQG